MIVSLTVNGDPVSVEVSGHESLLKALRQGLGLTGAKDSCEQGECGACTVILDGDAVCSCLVLAADAEGSTVTTVEGIGPGPGLHPVQQAFLERGAVQCGYCTPGLVVAAAHYLAGADDPSPTDLREALSGNLCRCTGYGSVFRALESLLEGEP